MNRFEELGLERSATATEIRQAYRNIVRLIHPDHCQDDNLRHLADLQMQRLNETAESEIHALIMRQADEAAFLAWLTLYPLLTFPCLFEERAAAATEQARRRARLYWNGLELHRPTCAA